MSWYFAKIFNYIMYIGKMFQDLFLSIFSPVKWSYWQKIQVLFFRSVREELWVVWWGVRREMRGMRDEGWKGKDVEWGGRCYGWGVKFEGWSLRNELRVEEKGRKMRGIGGGKRNKGKESDEVWGMCEEKWWIMVLADSNKCPSDRMSRILLPLSYNTVEQI